MRHVVHGISFIVNGPYWLHRHELESYAQSYKRVKHSVRHRVSAALRSRGVEVPEADFSRMIDNPVFDLTNCLVNYELPDGFAYRMAQLRVAPGSGRILLDRVDFA